MIGDEFRKTSELKEEQMTEKVKNLIAEQFQGCLKLEEELKGFINQLEILLKNGQLNEKEIEKELIGAIGNYLLIEKNDLSPQTLAERVLNGYTRRLYQEILLGTAVGDALGHPVQFTSREYLRSHPVTIMANPAKWSDDTSLSLCLADSLRQGYNLCDIADRFKRWLHEGLWTPYGRAFDIGKTTLRAIANFSQVADPRLAGLAGERDNGNGSLMRIPPLVPYIRGMEQERQIEMIAEVSSLTHRHPRSILACIFLCQFELCCIKGEDLPTAFGNTQTIVRYLLERKEFSAERPHFARLLNLSFDEFKDLPESQISSSGYVISTLEASLWCLFNHDNFKDTLLAAVNLGDDADTTGAVTGAMAGLFYGTDSIPSEWIDAIPRKDDFFRLADSFGGYRV